MNPEPDLSARTLTLTRTFDAPPGKVYRAWTDPALYKQWNVPRPWVITEAELDPRPGGTNRMNMRSPEGVDYPDAGIYLEVIPEKRLVFTDAYTSAWLPSEKPFMTVSVDFEPLRAGRRRGNPSACCTGPSPTARSTSAWASTRAGASAPISSPSCSPESVLIPISTTKHLIAGRAAMPVFFIAGMKPLP